MTDNFGGIMGNQQKGNGADTNNAVKCQNCGTTLTQGAKFCPECGTKVELPQKVACPHCGAEVQGGKFCPECGGSLIPSEKICPNCGNKFESGKFCPECGTKCE